MEKRGIVGCCLHNGGKRIHVMGLQSLVIWCILKIEAVLILSHEGHQWRRGIVG